MRSCRMPMYKAVIHQCSHDRSSVPRVELGGLTTVGEMTVKSAYVCQRKHNTSIEQHLRDMEKRRGQLNSDLSIDTVIIFRGPHTHAGVAVAVAED